MAYCVVVDDDGLVVDERLTGRARPQALLGSLALFGIALACGWTLYSNLAADRGDDVVTGPRVTIVTAQPAAPETAAAPVRRTPAKPSFFTAPKFDVSLLDATGVLTPAAEFSLSRSGRAETHAFRPTASPAAPRMVQSVPMPVPRPAELAQLTKPALQPATQRPSLQAMTQRGKTVQAKAADGLFERLFGIGQRDDSPTLAYAPTDGGVFNDGQSRSSGRFPATDSLTAVYDISARTVYMPDGTKLEAHSGLRDKLDDPRFVNVKMRGATPPHTYDLVPREALFHGVQALRMIPVGGEGEIFGRTGLLAHTYMLGPNGDSNGCVSFRDYDAFLRAYQQGKVKRLVVVAHGGRSMLASN